MLLGATAALVVLGSWLMVILATRIPALGVRFTVPERGPGLVVAEVHATSPAAGVVQPGARVVAIGPKDGPRRELSAESLVEDPDFLPTYERRRAFFEEQGRLREVLDAPEVTLYLEDGGEALVRPRHRRSEGWLPAVFWFQLACGAIGMLTGAAVFALRGGNIAARLYGFTGLSFAVITFTAAVYSARELALGTTMFRWLAATDHLGAMGFAVGFIALIWHYPRPLGDAPVFRVLAVVLGLDWVLDTASLLPAPTWGIQAPMIAGLVLSCVLGVLQWRRSARDPLGRAAVRWFSLSVFLGGSCFVVSIFVMVWLGREPVFSQGYAFGFVLTMYLGVALGVAR